MKRYHRLTLEEWQRLYVMKGRGLGIREIAEVLGRDRRSVSRALQRYHVPWHMKNVGPYEKAKHAWDESLRSRRGPRKRQRLKSGFIRKYVEEKLKAGLSPELIAGRLQREYPGEKTNYESIYEWIFEERPELKQYLLRAGKPKRGKPGARAYKKREPAAPKKSIEARPLEANQRCRLGDKESDLIVSAKSDACLLVVTDRRSRQLKLKKVPNRQAETVKAALVSLLVVIPPHLRRTLTQDNGSEHALHAELERVLGISVFFCHPYSAWERGTVENRNGIIRRYFPKGTDFALVSDAEVARVEALINSRPMKLLDFFTPEEFHQQEAKLAA
ncbi:MAG: IS30 family transposase [Deltaproteobacteria bacterium]|nr:IS30 family transposase [Deltaproteobacteria bacterium]